MATVGSERSQPVLLQTAEPMGEAEARIVRRPEPKFGFAAVTFALVMSAFWVGAAAAYLWGYFGPKGLAGLDVQELALFAAATFIPPLLFVAAAWALARAQEMAAASQDARRRHRPPLLRRRNRIAHRRASGPRRAPRTRCAERRSRWRLRAPAGAGNGAGKSDRRAGRSRRARRCARRSGRRAPDRGTRAHRGRRRLAQRRRRARHRNRGRPHRAVEVHDRNRRGAAQDGGPSLDVQAAGFRAAASAAADAPHAAAVELDRQAKRIEAVADAAMARAEFVLAARKSIAPA